MGVCTDIPEGRFVVALMEGVMVVYGLTRAAMLGKDCYKVFLCSGDLRVRIFNMSTCY